MTDALLEEKHQEEGVNSGDEDLRQYIREIRQYPLLTQEEELALAKRCACGDEDAIRQMVNSNLRLVVSIAREYAGRGVPLLDLVQEGSIGLIVAARKFDYTMDCRFSTYASKWIRQRIQRCLTNHAGVIRVPAHTAQRMRKLLTAKASFLSENGREPTLSELAKRADIPEEKAEELLRLSPEICSLDAPVGEDGESTMEKLLSGDDEMEPQAVLIRQELCALLDEMMGELNQRQQTILRLRFGMDDGACHSLEDIAQGMGISKERVRQIESQAIKKLNKRGLELGLEDFLE